MAEKFAHIWVIYMAEKCACVWLSAPVYERHIWPTNAPIYGWEMCQYMTELKALFQIIVTTITTTITSTTDKVVHSNCSTIQPCCRICRLCHDHNKPSLKRVIKYRPSETPSNPYITFASSWTRFVRFSDSLTASLRFSVISPALNGEGSGTGKERVTKTLNSAKLQPTTIQLF